MGCSLLKQPFIFLLYIPHRHTYIRSVFRDGRRSPSKATARGTLLSEFHAKMSINSNGTSKQHCKIYYPLYGQGRQQHSQCIIELLVGIMVRALSVREIIIKTKKSTYCCLQSEQLCSGKIDEKTTGLTAIIRIDNRHTHKAIILL